jgi:hypothetical protein
MEDDDITTGRSLLAAVAGVKRQLLLQGRVGQEEETGSPPPPLLSLWRVDLLYALVRLAGRLLLSCSSSPLSEPAITALAFLWRAATALDLKQEWQEAAAAGAGGAAAAKTREEEEGARLADDGSSRRSIDRCIETGKETSNQRPGREL